MWKQLCFKWRICNVLPDHARESRILSLFCSSTRSKVPSSTPPQSHNEVQIRLNQGLSGPCFWDGGGIEGGILEFHEENSCLQLLRPFCGTESSRADQLCNRNGSLPDANPKPRPWPRGRTAYSPQPRKILVWSQMTQKGVHKIYFVKIATVCMIWAPQFYGFCPEGTPKAGKSRSFSAEAPTLRTSLQVCMLVCRRAYMKVLPSCQLTAPLPSYIIRKLWDAFKQFQYGSLTLRL